MLAGKCALDNLEHEWFYGNILSFSTTRPTNPRNEAKETSRQVSELNPPGTLEEGEKMVGIEEDPGSLSAFMAKIVQVKAEEEILKGSQRPRPRTKRRKKFGSVVVGDINGRMPPLSDDVAMKEHLKSWAYAVAVACSVK